MSVEVVMPQMGESIAEGTIIKWHKTVGDTVERDEPLFEITTDKVDTEVPAPESGVLQQILVKEDETVAVGTVVAIVGDGAGVAETVEATSNQVPDPEPVEAPESKGHFQSSHEPKLFERLSQTSSPDAPPAPSPPHRGAKSSILSPVVAALAAEHGISMDVIQNIPGSGRGGRVTKKDILRHIETAGSTTPVAPPAPTLAPTPTPGALAAPPERYLYRPEPDDELVPMSPMRQQVAEHMVWSQQISAHVTSFTECDMHRIVRFRDEKQGAFEDTTGVPLTFLPFVAEATVRALKEFPVFNASVVGNQIAMKKRVHLGIAVSLEQGLIVPVVRNADEMNFMGLARSIHDAAEKARGDGLRPADVQGASFTITNPGMFGGLTGTPMIPQPQVAILGLGAVSKKPVVVDDAIAIRPVMVLALTFDHRVIDGATGFQFLERIRIQLEQADPPLA